MNPFKLAALGIALSSAAVSADNCVSPDMPQLPDGASSSLQQMLAGQKAVKAFQAANLKYMACLEPRLAAAQSAVKAGGDKAVDDSRQIQELYNAAVSQEEELAGQFNIEIREYKAANPG